LEQELLNQLPEPLRSQLTIVFSSQAARLAKLAADNALLREQIRLLLIKKFGPASEQLSDGQLSLLELEPSVSAQEVAAEAALPAEVREATPEAQPAQAGQPKEVNKPIRKPLPAHLPREERIIPCAEADCVCAQCGGERPVFGFECSERLSMRPAVYYVEVTKREKRACPRCEELGVSVAPVPSAIVEKGILSDRLVIDVAIKKYVEHAPLFRQALSIKREAELEMSQTTLCNAMMKTGELLDPVCGAMGKELLSGNYIQADETPMPVQSPATKGRDHKAYVWEYSRPFGPVVYEFRMGREREGPRNFLKDYGGRLQTDGYAAYNKIGGKGMEHFACMAHARRKFIDASKIDPKDARPVAIIGKIGELYGVEKSAREAGLDDLGREALRKEKSVPILAELKAMILKARAEALPKGALGRACDYALGLWVRLERYAAEGNGMVEIDNNWAENAMRPLTLGRKNWLHIGSEEAGPKVAAVMSVMETCKRLQINVREYLEDVLPRIADWPMNRIAELTPMAWLAGRNKS
jgi:transposase